MEGGLTREEASTLLGTEDMTEVVYDLPLGWVPIPFLWGSDRTVSRAAV